MKTFLCLLVFVSFFNIANAADGDFLYTQCKDYDPELKTKQDVWCLAYVTGFIEGAAIDRMAETEGANRFCVDTLLTFNQMTLAVKKYLENNPELLRYPGSYLVNDALAAAYPCK